MIVNVADTNMISDVGIPFSPYRKFDQLAKVMSEENRFENLRREMRANITSGVFCVPYLAWFLNSVITNDTLFEVHRDRELGLKNNRYASSSVSGSSHEVVRRKVSGRPMSWRNSICSVSLPSSPAHSVNCRKNKDEKSQKRGIVLSKSENDLLESSDSCLGLAVSGGSSSQLAITRSHSTQIMPSFTETTAEGASATTTDPKDLFVRHSAISSDSSIDEHSPQTDSAVALESLGHLSPVQQQQHVLGSVSSCAMSLPCRPRTNSILSYSDDYVLPEVEVSFGDSDADDETDNVFDSSFPNHLATTSLPPLTFESTEEVPVLNVNGLVGRVPPPNGDSAPVSLTAILGKHLVSDSNLNSLPGRSISTRDGVMHGTLPSMLTNLGSLMVSGDGDGEDNVFSNDLYGFAYYSPQCGILLSSVTTAGLRKRTSMSEASCSNEIIKCLPLAPKTVFPPSNGDGEKAQRDQTEDVQIKADKPAGPTSSSSSDAEQEPNASLSLSGGKVLPSVCQEHHSTSPVVAVTLRRHTIVHDQSASMTALVQYQRLILQHTEHLSKRHRLTTLLKSRNWLSEIDCLELSKQIEPNNHSL